MAGPKRVFLLANLEKEDALSVARRVRDRLQEQRIEVMLRADLASALGSGDSAETIHPDTDLVLCLGGDGTLLQAVRAMEGLEVPTLGINLGGLGFLTAVPSDELETSLDDVVEGRYRVRDRRLLRAVGAGDEGKGLELYALNDIVFDEGTFSRRAVVLKLNIRGTHIGTFTADGLIVSTATGSTAYSLSAGGPIVHPRLPALVATPICAHSLSIRPLVFGQEEHVEVENLLPGVSLKITADGQDSHRLAAGETVRIQLSERKARLAFLGTRSYYEILRTKLNWGGIPKKR